MYLALFSFHLLPKLAITLSMLPEAGAISYFDWFRTLNRLELSAHDMYDAGFWGPQLGPVNCLCILQLSFFLHECSGGKALFFRLSKSRIFYVSEEIYKLIRNTNWNKLQIFFGRIPFCKSFLNPSINAKHSVWKKVCSRHSSCRKFAFCVWKFELGDEMAHWRLTNCPFSFDNWSAADKQGTHMQRKWKRERENCTKNTL